MFKYPTTLAGIQEGLRKKKFTAVEYIEALLERIDHYDKELNAFISIDKEGALKAAKEADQRGYTKELPFNGIPIAIKDNIMTTGMKMTAASKYLAEFEPTFDATVIEKLKEAGAIIIGKTNLDEFAMGGSSETSHFGISRNPWKLDRIPGGSSGGSAVAVAADLTPFALGTDTGGSLRSPAAYTNTVAMKPTYGRVSRFGLASFAGSLDVIGPMTNNVADNAALLQLLAGLDEHDMMSLPDEVDDFSAKIGKSIKGLKIAFPKEYKSELIAEEIRQKMEEVVNFFEEQGAIVEEVELPYAKYGVPAYYAISSAEGSSSLQRYDGIHFGYRSPDAKDLNEVYFKSRSEAFGDEVKRRILMGTFLLSAEQNNKYYIQAAKVRTLIKKDFKNILQKYDVIIGPVTTDVAPKFSNDNDPMKMYAADLLTVGHSLAGIPSLALPAGFSSTGLPIGFQIAGKPLDEATLYQVGYAYETAHEYVAQKPTITEGE